MSSIFDADKKLGIGHKFDRAFALFSVPFAAALGGLLGQIVGQPGEWRILIFFILTVCSSFVVLVCGQSLQLILQDGWSGVFTLQSIGPVIFLTAFLCLFYLSSFENSVTIATVIMLLLIWMIGSLMMAMHFSLKMIKNEQTK